MQRQGRENEYNNKQKNDEDNENDSDNNTKRKIIKQENVDKEDQCETQREAETTIGIKYKII